MCARPLDSRYGCRLVLRSLDPHRRRAGATGSTGSTRSSPASTSRGSPTRSGSCSRTSSAPATTPTWRRWRPGSPRDEPSREISFSPARVLLQDFTGVPAVVDLAAMRDAMADLGGEAAQINPLIPVELVIDHSVQVDEFGTRAAFRQQRRARVRAQLRALRVPPLGPGGLPRLQGRAARHRDRPPGQPRVPRPRDRDARRRGLPGHARRHRLAHDDGQRARRARLGRRRDRGRGGDARRGGLDARPAGRRLPALRRAARRRDRDRPRPDGDADPPRDRRRRQVRRVLRPRPRRPAARRPRDDREHVARVRRHLRLLPRRRGDAQVPAPDRPGRAAGRARRGLLQGEPALARPGRDADLLAGRRARPDDRRAVARRAAPSAGPRAAPRREGGVRRGARHVRRRLSGRLARQGGGELVPRVTTRRRDDAGRAAEHDRGAERRSRRARHAPRPRSPSRPRTARASSSTTARS